MSDPNSFADSHGGYAGDRRPVPDPTILTTQAAERLEVALRNLITAEIGHLNDKLREQIVHGHETTAAELGIVGQKFVGVDDRFVALEKRTAEQKSDTNTSLTAALAAQEKSAAATTLASEKSIDKSETATNRRIEGVEGAVAANLKVADDKISDLKDRVVAIESNRVGRGQSGDTVRAIAALAISVIVMIVVAAGFVLALTR